MSSTCELLTRRILQQNKFRTLAAARLSIGSTRKRRTHIIQPSAFWTVQFRSARNTQGSVLSIVVRPGCLRCEESSPCKLSNRLLKNPPGTTDFLHFLAHARTGHSSSSATSTAKLYCSTKTTNCSWTHIRHSAVLSVLLNLADSPHWPRDLLPRLHRRAIYQNSCNWVSTAAPGLHKFVEERLESCPKPTLSQI